MRKKKEEKLKDVGGEAVYKAVVERASPDSGEPSVGKIFVTVGYPARIG